MKDFSSPTILSKIKFFSSKKQEEYNALNFLQNYANIGSLLRDCYEQVEDFDELLASDFEQILDFSDATDEKIDHTLYVSFAQALIHEAQKDKNAFRGCGDKDFFAEKKNKTRLDYFVHRYIRKCFGSMFNE